MTDGGPSDIRDWVVAEFPQFAAVTRIFWDDGFFTREGHQFRENVLWADPNVFDVLHFRAVAGTLAGALDRPDTLVLTRRVAEKYFGRPDPLGETLVLNDQHAMTVTAVIEDLPSNTELQIEILASARSSYSRAVEQERIPMTVVGAKRWSANTFALLKPNESIEPLREGIRTLPDRHSEIAAGGKKASEVWPLDVRSIPTLHLGARDVAHPDRENFSQLYGVVGIGALILLAAAINFVTLRTALAMRRAVEVGVRKACGASRQELFLQFTGEVFVHVCG
jgi:putative ABC transport system permease protein